MEFDLNGCGQVTKAAAIIVIICAVGLGALLILSGSPGDGQDPQAQREYARADRIRAQVELEAQEQVNFEHSFMLWTTALAAFHNDSLFTLLLIALALATSYLAAQLGRNHL